MGLDHNRAISGAISAGLKTMLILAASIAITNLHAGPSGGLAKKSEVAQLLRVADLDVSRDVKRIPYRDLVAAGVIAPRRAMRSFMANPGEPFQSGDVWSTTKPMRQLIAAAVTRDYLVISFLQGTQGGPAAYVLVIRRAGAKSKVVFHAVLSNDIDPAAWNWEEVKRHVLREKMVVLTSSEHPDPYDSRLP